MSSCHLKSDKELRGWVCLTAIMALISPMELRPYFLGPNFFWRPDLGWKQSILGPTNYLPDVSNAL